ncbi:hypothetical protein L207DRAFT_627106 [Hyaloscypha variabilis F]|uniref:Uncharacterized protein n=1 Tax=Hyaloscypha variabilis (strain UAMH 11265 / GT02V1 / F) TaxID=1149755 RepID=A0A2J6SC71_HYAVF|nr:hypothetical protein L207DRAFT_627106 [Hyaloscypha variabilis F]
MLPASLLALTASFILPLIAAASTPVCIPSAEGYQLDTLDTLYQSFCSDLSKSGFSASQELYGVPVISLRFVPTPGVDKCDQANCLSTFGTLAQSCSMNNYSVSGIGSLDAGCGTYNFTVSKTNSNPIGPVTSTVTATCTPVLLNLATTQSSISSSTGKPTTTKPYIGSTALGTSDSAIMKVSGVSLLGVALIFCFL